MSSFERLANEHKDAVYRQMVRVCGNADDAEDVLVEALLAAYKALPTMRDEANFRGWLAIVGRRVCSRIKRKEALLPVLALSEQDIEQSAGEPEIDLKSCLLEALDALPDSYREPYRLFAIDGLDQKEIAHRLNLDLNTVKTRVRRAKEKLRDTLDQGICSAF
ncbi:MAG TPA: sigma-70 family RNA polymerase sigma factor [Fimbriimonadaceae bacterium]|nr:sigma-70 family RNA polymerase sigma factor [Fimbriimonadaceae bacterium]